MVGDAHPPGQAEDFRRAEKPIRLAAVRLSAALLAVALAAAPFGAWAHPAVDQGRKLYDDLEYKKAQKALEKALKAPDLTDEDRQTALQYLALCQSTLGDLPNAAASFKSLLDLNPKFTLDRASTPPKILDLFEKVRSTMPQAQEPDRVVVRETEIVLTHIAPADCRPTKPLDLLVKLRDVDHRSSHLAVRYRERGSGGFSEVKVASAAEATLQVPGMFVRVPRLEYYIAALDASGKVLTSAGSEEQPLSVPVNEEVRAGTPVYKRWWFWAIAGVLVVGAGAAVAVAAAAGGGGGGGGSTSVTVTFMP
jgi:tetratricopeptide (TPR) repeat protein